MKKCFYICSVIFFGLLISVNAQDRTQSFEIDSLTGEFNARYTVTPNSSNIDAAFGLGPVNLTGWGDFNCIVRFNPDGFIDARNGGGYGAENDLVYEKGKRYYISISGNVDSLKYSVIAREEGDTAVIIADDYGFRENNYQGFIKYASQRAVEGSLSISNFQIGSEHIDDHDNFNVQLDKPLVGDYAVKLRATPSSSNMNGGIGLSKKMMTAWGDFNNIINFGPDGTIKIRNGNGYTNDTVFYYEGGQDYTFYIWGNTDSTTYSVKLVTADGQMLDLATNYDFRHSNPGDTLNYVAQRIVYNPNSDGIPDSYIAIDGIEYGSIFDFDPYPMIAIPQEMKIQTGSFSKTFVATPSSDEMDHSISFNSSSSVAWGDLSAIIRFNSDGMIDARNGGSYMAVNEVTYKAGQTHIFDVDLDVEANTYSALVKTEIGATPDTIAFDYAFRKSPVDTLMYMTFKGNPSKGYLTYSEVGIGKYVNPSSSNAQVECLEPTIGDIDDVDAESKSGEHTVNLSGITFGGEDIPQSLSILATSSNTSVIPDPSISAIDEDGNAVLTLQVNEVETFTEVTITVVVSDDCNVAENGGVASISKTFLVSVSPETSIDNEAPGLINVYPNPAHSRIVLENSSDISRVELIRTDGIKVMSVITEGKDMLELNISKLSPGIYLLRSYNGTKMIYSKLVIKQ